MSALQLVAKDTVVSFHYTLKNKDGEVLDSSDGGDALSYLHGHGQIVPGLENALLGKAAGGAPFTVVVPAEEGYGVKRPEMIITVPREHWKLPDTVGVGAVVELQSDQGQRLPARVIELKPDGVVLDANHPLAGEALHFDITITGVRPATQEELAHGHAHGPGGHQH
jgi:FKBP-type peptidyl-prolyl cis-trans isomerase SlyD